MSNNSNNMESKELQRIQELESLLRINQPTLSSEISLKELWKVIWSGKWTIIIISLVFSVCSVVYALSQPNVYRASVLLAPANMEGGAGGLSKLAGQFGGLASLAGLNLGGSGADKTQLSLAVLKSRKFINEFIEKNNILVPLMAAESWNRGNGQLVYDPEVYNIETQMWVREATPLFTSKPTSWEAFERFSSLLSVSPNPETGMIDLSLEFYSPTLAKKWLSMIVTQLNENMREQENKEAQNSIDFLTKKLSETHLTDMKNVFYQLIEQQTKTIMLAEVSEEYVLKTVDPANVPDNKVKPKRVLIVILGTLFGGMLSIFIVLIRYFQRRNS